MESNNVTSISQLPINNNYQNNALQQNMQQNQNNIILTKNETLNEPTSQIMNQNPNPTLGELLAMRNKSLHFQGGFQNLSRILANKLVKLSPEQSEALIDDLKFQYNLFGDPSARLFPLK